MMLLVMLLTKAAGAFALLVADPKLFQTFPNATRPDLSYFPFLNPGQLGSAESLSPEPLG